MLLSLQKDLNSDRNCGPPSVRAVDGYPHSWNHETNDLMTLAVVVLRMTLQKGKPEYLSTTTKYVHPLSENRSMPTSLMGYALSLHSLDISVTGIFVWLGSNLLHCSQPCVICCMALFSPGQ